MNKIVKRSKKMILIFLIPSLVLLMMAIVFSFEKEEDRSIILTLIFLCASRIIYHAKNVMSVYNSRVFAGGL